MSSHAFYHDHPETLCHQTEVIASQPGRVRLAHSPFFPGGGGQMADRGMLRWQHGELPVTGFEGSGRDQWLVLADPVADITGTVEAVVDPAFRQMMRELHTGTHILNALVFQNFDGALVTGVQMNEDGTARMDFDVPGADNDRLRSLEAPVKDVLRQNLAVTDSYIGIEQAAKEHGLIRSRSVAPPANPDGTIRIVEIRGLDRQACGGTHLAETGTSRPIRILKIENKGRHNRRVRIGLA